ncbi:LysM peptidoglycan-binding domain-containing M23 family metallopeptidase [Deinococcus sonorensis]|uniref:LysM peptidoglycan-binding domain-containing M23 family metallopeptidase n=2 Tax=Deinococcus sonorensis TaxID=309891 RepID=A0AAU7UAH2_9DEIO
MLHVSRLLLIAALLGTPAVQAQSGSGKAALVYVVQPGDTLYHIATTRGLDIEELRRVNQLSSDELSVGQTLRLPSGSATPSTPSTPAPARTPSSPSPAPSTVPAISDTQLAGVSIRVPARLSMGDAFVVRLSGNRAGQARVRFPSEVGEDVHKPAETLTPIGAAGEYLVLGRVVLGKTTPLVYEVQVGSELMRGSIPVTGLDQKIQHLNLPASLTDKLKDPYRQSEEAAVEKAYARRTPQAWSRPFSPPLSSSAISSSFGQPRTYMAGGPVAYHYGIDFPSKVGTPVHAVNDGTVVIAGKYPVRGWLVGIDHGAGLVSLYFHQSKIMVKVGQHVTRGQVVGVVGTTGLSNGPHLHLEMRVRGEGTRPTLYFGKLWP